jgi:hypothetical protein
LSTGCKRVAAKLDWDQPAEHMENLYEQLVMGERQAAAQTH